MAGGLHPEQATLANCGKTFLGEIEALCVHSQVLAQEVGGLPLGKRRWDGSTIQADASPSKAVSYQRLLESEEPLPAQGHDLLRLGESAEHGASGLPGGLVIEDEITRRQVRLENLAQAKAVVAARARARYQAEQAEYEAQIRERQETAKQTKRRPAGKPAQPAQAGARDTARYPFSDPDWRLMKNRTAAGVDQPYTVPLAVDQTRLRMVAQRLAQHPPDTGAAQPRLAALAPQLGQVEGAALDNGAFSPSPIDACEQPGSAPYSATGRHVQHPPWPTFLARADAPPPDTASPKVKLADTLQTQLGREIERLRKCTLEPLMGLIKEGLGCRQFSLPGRIAAAGQWPLGCLACNVKRRHGLCSQAAAA